MNRGKTISSAMIAVVFCLLAGSALAADWLPLEIGNFWSSINEWGQVETRIVNGTATIQGHEVFGIYYFESPENQGLRNFWTTGPDGEIYLHGFLNGFGYVYDPPILWLDPQAPEGATWTTEFTAYDYFTGDPSFTTTITLQSFGAQTLEVPAGTFETLACGYEDQPACSDLLKGRDLTGKKLADPVRGATDWYSDGVGEVQYATFGENYFKLQDYQAGPVAVRSLTMDAVKTLFR